MENRYKKYELIANLSTQIFCTQLAQIKVWLPDENDLDKLETFCVESARSIFRKSEAMSLGDFDDES